MKLDAFWSRGEDDYFSSRDLEDIIAVIDGRDEIVKECAAVPSNRVAAYLSEKMIELLESDDFLEALPGHLAGDPGSQAREPIILERMRKIRVMCADLAPKHV